MIANPSGLASILGEVVPIVGDIFVGAATTAGPVASAVGTSIGFLS